jgi:autoinducer 2-degrading protein
VVPDCDLSLVIAQLPTHIQLTRREEGCLRFDVTQSQQDQKNFSVYEEFVDRAAFEAHQRRAQASDWGRATTNVERHYKVTDPS